MGRVSFQGISGLVLTDTGSTASGCSPTQSRRSQTVHSPHNNRPVPSPANLQQFPVDCWLTGWPERPLEPGVRPLEAARQALAQPLAALLLKQGQESGAKEA